jgi:pyridoxamine 5'-phosphate oxidase
MTKSALADLRREYTLAELRRKDLAADPLEQFHKWFDDAVRAEVLEANALSLATVDAEGQPSIRTVLLKVLDERGFIFFTNYTSAKGQELAGNPRVALLFHWRELERQVAVRGVAAKISREESAAYFQSRPRLGKLGAWASNQSERIPNREFLEEKLAALARQHPGEEVPMPPYWGGYVVTPETIEFWQGGAGRLHDRFRYTRSTSEGWIIDRLSP